MLITRNTKINIIIVALIGTALLVVGAVVGEKMFLYSIPVIFYPVIIIYWASLVNLKVVNYRIRRLFLLLAANLVYWSFIQIYKYNMLENEITIIRYSWYSYYIPLVSFPLLCFMIALGIGDSELGRYNRLLSLLWCVAGAMILMVFTNDLHEWVFIFYNGFELSNSDYRYGPGYYIIMMWILVLISLSLLISIRKIVFAAVRRDVWIPTIIFVIGVIYGLLNSFTRIFYYHDMKILRFQQMFSTLIIAFWESCIQIGMVRSNRNYDRLFVASSTNMVIQDKSNNIVYSTNGFQKDTTAGSGRRIHRMDITGGSVVWIDDISRLLEARSRLSDVKGVLSEEGELLKAEKEMQERKTRLMIRDRVYSMLSEKLEEKNQEIERLIDADIPNRIKLAKISVLGAYIKRWSNLKLLQEREHEQGNTVLATKELTLSIKESLEYAESMGLRSYLDMEKTLDYYDGNILIDIYEHFEVRLEKLLEAARYVYVRMYERNGGLVLEMTEDDEEEPSLRYQSGGER